MKFSPGRSVFIISLLLLSLGAGCMLHPAPPDLHIAQQRLIAYYDRGTYAADVARAVKPAVKFLERRANPTEKLAVVFDVDETVLSNWPQLEQEEFSYCPADWDAWVMQAEARPIAPVLAVYQRAHALGYAVFFITGRAETQREATEHNLRSAGYTRFEELTLKSAGLVVQSAADYKAPARARIESLGWTIVLNIGDQQSDLEGGFAEKTIKLPNPFYFIE